METRIDPVRKDRTYLWSVSIAMAVGIVWVIADVIIRTARQSAAGVVGLRLQQIDGITVPVPSGSSIEVSGVVTGAVATSEIAPGAVVMLRIADAIGAASWVGLIILVGVIAIRLARGRVFDRASMTLLNWLSAALIAVPVVPQFVRVMGTNWAISSLGYEGTAPSPAGSEGLWPAYLAVLFVGCIQVAFRGAGRLARDQDGIV